MANSDAVRSISDAAIQFLLDAQEPAGLGTAAEHGSCQVVLHLLVDTTGIKFLGESEGKCKKHGPERRRQWRKLHIGIDAQTLQIRAICVTSSNASDAAVIPDLLQQLPDDEVLESLTGDGAYDTQAVHEEVIKRGGIPIIPPRKNARIRKGKAFVHRNAVIAAC